MKSTRSILILCLALAGLVLVWAPAAAPVAQRWAAVWLLGAFACAIALLQLRFVLGQRPRAKLNVEAWSMVAFVTGMLWFTGKSGSPLFNLYLFPVVLSALTLGRAATLCQVGVIVACHVGLAASTPGLDVASLGYAGRAVGELAPFLLVAYLTSTLSADVTAAREHIESLAHNDALTGLYNGRMFTEVWQREHAATEARSGVYALLLIDMDRLKDINDTFGHDGGNSAIVLVAGCVQRSIRTSDIAGRMGSDEFAVLLPGATPDVAETVIKRLRHNVYKTTLDLRSRMIRCSVSIGVVNYPKDGRELNGLLSAAERNMFRDKELRRAPDTQVRA